MSDRTVNEIIDDAYLQGNIHSPDSTQDANALRAFQNMLSLWSIEGLIVPSYTTENFTLTIGQAVYTIGPSGDFDTVRPLKIVSAFIKIDTDYPVDVRMTKSEYSDLASKDTESRPSKLYYDPQYPKGEIKFDYEANVAYDFHMVSEKPLVDVAAITDTLSLPLGMNEVLVFNLAIRLAPHNNIKLKPQVFAIAKSSKETLENYNARDKLRDTSSIDRGLTYGVTR